MTALNVAHRTFWLYWLSIITLFEAKTTWVNWCVIWCDVVQTCNELDWGHWSNSKSPGLPVWMVSVDSSYKIYHGRTQRNWIKSIRLYHRAVLKYIVGSRFIDPLMFGDYPSSMRTRVGSRLPKFSRSESALVKGSLDFVGINHYTTYYAKANTTSVIGVLLNDSIADSGAITLRKQPRPRFHNLVQFSCIHLSWSYLSDWWLTYSFWCVYVTSVQRFEACWRQGMQFLFTQNSYVCRNSSLKNISTMSGKQRIWENLIVYQKHKQLPEVHVLLVMLDFQIRILTIGFLILQANSIWLYIVPHGIRSLMNYIKTKYGNPPVIITENGNNSISSPCSVLVHFSLVHYNS